MEAICTTPRSLHRSSPPGAQQKSPFAAAPMVVALFAFGLSGCSILFPPGGDCPSLEQVCPDLECPDGFVVDEGCAQCECAEPEPEPDPDPVVCSSDVDCADDERCVFDVEPSPEPSPTEPAPPPDGGSGDRACEPNPDGTCGEVPKEEPGVVAPSGVCLPAACEELSDEECLNHPECELVSNGGAAPCFSECDPEGNCTSECEPMPPPDDATCVTRVSPPPPEGDCVVDADCAEGQFCEIQDECGSLCDPSSREPCADVCVVVGFCQDEPTTTSCQIDEDCGTGFLCEQTEICECSDGSSSDPPEDAGAPAPCLEECRMEGQCVWNPDNQTCFSDGDCASTQHCEFLDSCMAPPDCTDCLIACEGVCVDDEPVPVPCSSETQCSEGQLCTANTDPGDCNTNPSCAEGEACTDECWGYCIDPEPVASDKCLEEADCAEGYRCASEVDACYCPEGETCDVCYWQCVPDDTTAP